MKFDAALLEANPGGVSLLARGGSIIDDEDEDADAAGFANLIDSHIPDGDDDE
jgi:DNA-directed RNA polymerase subunit alpha